MTSPRAPRYSQINIDEYADPDNPLQPIYGRPGITDAEEIVLDTQHITSSVTAEATAGTDRTEDLEGQSEFDGAVTGVTFSPTATITGDGTNNRTFKVWNKTADHALFTITTTATHTGGSVTAMVADGSDQTVSVGDEFEVKETHGGTGVAHGGATFVLTILESGAV